MGSVNPANGVATSLLYTAWGETRDSSGAMPTARQFTGQLQADAGLYFYQARFYDPGVMMFNQPDTLVPDPYNPLDWNRYSYARYNPLRYTDPTGHASAFGYAYSDPECQASGSGSGSSNQNVAYADLNSVSVKVDNRSDADIYSYAAFALDYTAFLLSGIEAGVSDGAIIGFTAIGCGGGGAFGPATIPAGCGAGALAGLGVDAWFSGWGSPLGAAENILGGLSLGFTATSDFLSGNTQVDTRQGNIRVGKDTIVSSRNFLLGQVPESNWDAWVSMSQAKYDTDRLLGKKQGGSYEIFNNWKLNIMDAVWAGYNFYFSDWW